MQWAEVLLVIVTYCAGAQKPTVMDKCRTERVNCVKRFVAENPNSNNAVEAIDQCLGEPGSFVKKEEKK